jgi:adenosine deaminase
MVTEEMIRHLPKVELHDHLDGGLRPATIIELGRRAGVELPAWEPSELASWFHRGADRKSLALYLEGFKVVLSVMQTAEALERIAFEALEDRAEDGIVYVELRFAPMLCTAGGLTLEVVPRASGWNRAAPDRGGVRPDPVRHARPDRLPETAELARLLPAKRGSWVSTCGDEYGHPPKKHLDAFEYIRRMNFNITIHAGEAFGMESIWQAIQYCGAHRIGHATRLREDMAIHGTRIEKMGSLAHFIRDKRIPLEMCLSSNVHTGAAASLDDHPFPVYYRNNFRTILCTDNRLMSNTNLCKEMYLAVTHYNLTLDDLEKLTLNAMKSSFIHHEDRTRSSTMC